MMPNDLPHWKTCYHYFRLWAKQGHWERIHAALRDMARLVAGKKSPDPLRLSIVKAFGQLASPEFVVMMRVTGGSWKRSNTLEVLRQVADAFRRDKGD